MRYRPILEWSNPGLHEWVHMSIPLMLGVSLVTADNWIINYFASHTVGAISLLTYAKQLFTAPVALGQAAGAASLPFFATLHGREDQTPFTTAVNASVSRILAFSILLTSFMVAMALPAIDVVLRGGAFHRPDSRVMALYFAIFSVSLCLWSAQAIYARAFYATGNTLTPMIAGTIVTFCSIPIYQALNHSVGPAGLAIASDIGILMQTATLAALLHRRRTVSLAGLDYRELLRCAIASIVTYGALVLLRHFVPTTNRLYEFGLLCVAGLVWIGISALVLRITGSALLSQLTSRFTKPATV
jgi:putative peptidoglycan lipid II flippase